MFKRSANKFDQILQIQIAQVIGQEKNCTNLIKLIRNVKNNSIRQYPGNIPPPTLGLIWFVLNLQKLRNEC